MITPEYRCLLRELTGLELVFDVALNWDRIISVGSIGGFYAWMYRLFAELELGDLMLQPNCSQPVYQWELEERMVSLERGPIFDRWNLNDTRSCWGTCTRVWRVRIVGPLDQQPETIGRFYYSVHNRTGICKSYGYAVGLEEAKRVAIAATLRFVPELENMIDQLENMEWPQLELLLQEERQRAIDDLALAGIAGVRPEEFYND